MIETIKIILDARYGIECDNIVQKTGGWSALAYKVSTENKNYFLKIYEKTNELTYCSSPIDFYMPILSKLNNTPLQGKILSPVLTLDDNYKVEDEQYIYTVFDYIDGEVVGNRELTKPQITELAEIIARLHMYGEEIDENAKKLKENFDLGFQDALKDFYANDCMTELIYLGELKDTILHYKNIVMQSLDKLHSMADKLKTKDIKMSFCHRDAHTGNIMQSGNNLILIDWEDLKLAPVEADLKRFVDTPYWKDFIEHYKKLRPEFILNKEILDFYVLEKILSVIRYFLGRFLHDRLPEEEHTQAVKYILEEYHNLEAFLYG